VEPDKPTQADALARQAAAELDAAKAIARKVAAALSVAIVLAIFVFWLGWVRAPSPQAICEHKVELVLATVGPEQRDGADALIDQLELKCVEAAERKIQMRGKIVYADYAKCVIAATTLAEAENC
jgi:hypothetical protein